MSLDKYITDTMCKGGFEIIKGAGHKTLSIELGAVFDAWPVRPELLAGFICEANWEMDGIGSDNILCPPNPDSEWLREVVINKNLDGHWEGFHWENQPASDCFGSKSLYLFFKHYDGSRLSAKINLSVSIAIYFVKGRWSTLDILYGWEDYDNDAVPNWFEYWQDHGCVHESMDEFVYRLGDYREGGHYDPITGELVLANRAPSRFPGYEIRDPNTGLVVESFPTKQGIDNCADVIVHEMTHQWVHHNWQNGIWNPENDEDNDGDGLTDSFENEVTHTNPFKSDTYNLKDMFNNEVYGRIGDQEFYCRFIARDVYAQDNLKDWSNPGKQTEPPF